MNLSGSARAAACVSLLLVPAVRAQESAPPSLEIPSTGFLSEVQRDAKRQELEAATAAAVLTLRARPATPVRALQHVVELTREVTHAPWQRFAVELGEDAPARIELDLPRTDDASRATVHVQLSVVEPGMAVLGQAVDGRARVDWRAPQCYLEPEPMERYLRGTTRARRAQELALANGQALPAIPEGALFASDANRERESWPRLYQQSVFTSPFAQNAIAFDRAARSPLRILLYTIWRRSAGSSEPAIYALSFDLEGLDAALRRVALETKEPAATHPALEIGLASDAVLGWSIAKPQRNGQLAEPRRAVLLSKPNFAPYWLASPTFDKYVEFAGTEQLHADRRQVPLYYDALGWSVQLEDLAEVVALLRATPAESGSPRLDQLFDRPAFALDLASTYVPEALLDAERRILDFAPLQALKKPPTK
ncbi:MAG: hypothetical protein JNM84_08385 [Planctomycetes bacterium]|nr:hypothetical protein [Planctomycetota bacterium]